MFRCSLTPAGLWRRCSFDKARFAAEGDWGDCQRLRGITGTYDPDREAGREEASMTSTQTTHTPWPALAAATAALAPLLLAVAPQAAAAGPPDKQPLHSFATEEPITGAFSMLDRSDDAIASKIRTAATPGHAVTMWYVIFNAPENCNAGTCGEDDIFVDGDPAAGFNVAQIEAARISVVYGGDGEVVNPGGRVALDGGLAEGEVPTGSVPVVIGHPDDGALVPGPVTGLEDAQTAEIHIVLQDHGTAHTDSDLLEEQLSGFQTACNPKCVDVQFAVHK